jgi:Fe-S cluster assembly protein SufD
MPVATEQSSDHYVAEYDRVQRNRVGQSWFGPVRKAAIAHFADQGFPTTRHEEWRYTNVAPITRTPFRLVGPTVRPVTLQMIRPFLFAAPADTRLVFVNGHFDPDLSAIGSLPEKATLASLANLLETEPDTLRPHLARYASFENSPFTALNTACFEDGAFLHVPRGFVLERPVHVLYVSAGGAEPVAAYPRTLIVAEEASQLIVVESYASLDESPCFTNAVTEIVAGDGAVVDHCRLQRESDAAFHIGMVRTHQQRDAAIRSHAFTLGGGLTRNDVHAVLDGEGGDLDLDGLYIGRGRRHIDNHLRVEHAQPHCNSREFYKGILEDESHGVFTGRIIVHKDAQKTDAKQTNMNLLLSGNAQIDSKPQLEIFADDVKCTHGATIGQIEETELFYLRSRGIPERDARSLLIYAFAAESIARVKVAPVRDTLERLLFAGAAEDRLLRKEGTLS